MFMDDSAIAVHKRTVRPLKLRVCDTYSCPVMTCCRSTEICWKEIFVSPVTARLLSRLKTSTAHSPKTPRRSPWWLMTVRRLRGLRRFSLRLISTPENSRPTTTRFSYCPNTEERRCPGGFSRCVNERPKSAAVRRFSGLATRKHRSPWLCRSGRIPAVR